MKTSGRALRVSIFLGEGDLWHHRPLYSEIVHRAHRAGLAGATVLRGIEGYGAGSRIHTAHVFRVSQDMPMVVILSDAEDRIRAFLPQLDDIIADGLLVLDEVDSIRYQRLNRARA